jgi:CRISPR-associated endonuclease Cas1
MENFPKLALLELHLKTLTPIQNLPHYHGPHWSALFRTIAKGGDYSQAYSDNQMRLSVLPIETGTLSYETGNIIHLGLILPFEQLSLLESILNDFNQRTTEKGHFQPGKTVHLEHVICRVGGHIWPEVPFQPLTPEILRAEVDHLCKLSEFHIYFYTPLRLTRPGKHKSPGHRYCDEDFFLGEGGQSALVMTHFLQKIRTPLPLLALTDVPIVCRGGLTWLDVTYGDHLPKTIGGVIGRLSVHGPMMREVAERFVIGQYFGVGKNAAFGLGFYIIPELDSCRTVKSLTRGTTLLDKVVATSTLEQSLRQLSDSSSGHDGITVMDLKKAGLQILQSLGLQLLDGSYRPGPAKKYRMHKKDGGFREIIVQNVTDRLLQRAAADVLTPVIDGLLDKSSYAYRRGLNRKGAAASLRGALNEGYNRGFKADIASFFDSVQRERLWNIMHGLFPFEPLVDRLEKSLVCVLDGKSVGIPQGNPLSPVLSNLYLDHFDRRMSAEGFRLIRFADDFVVLFRETQSYEETLQSVKVSLARLCLELKEEKTQMVIKGQPISFLGYLVTDTDIMERGGEKLNTEEGSWLPLFREEWSKGIPVYLTVICRGSYSAGGYLIIKKEGGGEEKILWNAISRLVVVGRSPFSGGVVYRAVKEEIPVTFIDILGRTKGHLLPEQLENPELVNRQVEQIKNGAFCLDFIKEIIGAKVHNSMVLLRRNRCETKFLKDLIKKIQEAENIETIRGYEGAASASYFKDFAQLLTPFSFPRRIYHPPDCPVNVMLSLGYTLLYNRISSVLRDKGFNPRLGFYHKGRGSHAALASDLMEELRHLVDRIVLSLIHRKEINEDDFIMSRKGSTTVCRMVGEGFRKFIRRFEITMATSFSYNTGDRYTYNAYLNEMADGLKRALKLNIPYKALLID